jgi:hypothetical protein
MGTKARCAYCGQKGKSREHIFPTWLIKKTPDYGAKFSKLSGKVGQNEHVITDVCEPCNNGPLGLLDDYCRPLHEEYFSKVVLEPLDFKYDFLTLTRWLLKVSFNSARKLRANVSNFQTLIPYMLGHDLAVPDRVIFFVEVIRPITTLENGKTVTFRPQDHRSSVLHFNDKPSFVFVHEGRLVAIESFYFYIIFLHTTLNNDIYSRLRPDFPEWFGRLTPDNAPLRLKPVRDYLALKQDEYRLNAKAYFEWRERHLKRQNDLSSE